MKGTCLNNKDNKPKCAIRQGVTSPVMSPRGEGPLTRQIRAQPGGEKSPKPKANMLQIAPNFAGVAHVVLEAYTMKIGPKRHTTSAPAPMLVRLWPIFGVLPLTASPNIGCLCIMEDLVQRMVVSHDRKACKEAQTPLHLHHCSYGSLI